MQPYQLAQSRRRTTEKSETPVMHSVCVRHACVFVPASVSRQSGIGQRCDAQQMLV